MTVYNSAGLAPDSITAGPGIHVSGAGSPGNPFVVSNLFIPTNSLNFDAGPYTNIASGSWQNPSSLTLPMTMGNAGFIAFTFRANMIPSSAQQVFGSWNVHDNVSNTNPVPAGTVSTALMTTGVVDSILTGCAFVAGLSGAGHSISVTPAFFFTAGSTNQVYNIQISAVTF